MSTDQSFGIVPQGTYPILEEESHIKDALSRIVVEMIKREWPQQWPDMLKEMETLTTFGVCGIYLCAWRLNARWHRAAQTV